MATRGIRTDASDEIFDFVGSPCSKKDKNNEAVKFCAGCQEYLCVTCVEYHNNFSVLAGHTLLVRSQFGITSKTASKDLPSVPTERCKVHTTKLVDMYCVTHDAVGCHVYFTFNHKPCQNIQYIPEYVQTTEQTSHIKGIEETTKKTILTISELMRHGHKARDENNKRKASSLQDIKDFRAEINQTLDRLEEATIAELDENYNKLESKVEEELTEMQETLDNLRKRMTEINSPRKNPSQKFVSSKISEKLISETEHNRTNFENGNKGIRLLARNPEVLSFLKGLESLENFKPKSSLYQILDKKSCYLKQKDEQKECDIYAACCLDSGDILLAKDWNMHGEFVQMEMALCL